MNNKNEGTNTNNNSNNNKRITKTKSNDKKVIAITRNTIMAGTTAVGILTPMKSEAGQTGPQVRRGQPHQAVPNKKKSENSSNNNYYLDDDGNKN